VEVGANAAALVIDPRMAHAVAINKSRFRASDSQPQALEQGRFRLDLNTRIGEKNDVGRSMIQDFTDGAGGKILRIRQVSWSIRRSKLHWSILARLLLVLGLLGMSSCRI